MKKILAILLAVVMLLPMFAVTTSAAGPEVFTLDISTYLDKSLNFAHESGVTTISGNSGVVYFSIPASFRGATKAEIEFESISGGSVKLFSTGGEYWDAATTHAKIDWVSAGTPVATLNFNATDNIEFLSIYLDGAGSAVIKSIKFYKPAATVGGPVATSTVRAENLLTPDSTSKPCDIVADGTLIAITPSAWASMTYTAPVENATSAKILLDAAGWLEFGVNYEGGGSVNYQEWYSEYTLTLDPTKTIDTFVIITADAIKVKSVSFDAVFNSVADAVAGANENGSVTLTADTTIAVADAEAAEAKGVTIYKGTTNTEAPKGYEWKGVGYLVKSAAPVNPNPTPTTDKKGVGGFIFINENYHAMLLGGRFLAMPHNDNGTGFCPTCRAELPATVPEEPETPDETETPDEPEVSNDILVPLTNGNFLWGQEKCVLTEGEVAKLDFSSTGQIGFGIPAEANGATQCVIEFEPLTIETIFKVAYNDGTPVTEKYMYPGDSTLTLNITPDAAMYEFRVQAQEVGVVNIKSVTLVMPEGAEEPTDDEGLLPLTPGNFWWGHEVCTLTEGEVTTLSFSAAGGMGFGIPADLAGANKVVVEFDSLPIDVILKVSYTDGTEVSEKWIDAGTKTFTLDIISTAAFGEFRVQAMAGGTVGIKSVKFVKD